MKTQILLTIEHSKPLPDITDVICQRVWPYGGGCITDMTAAIQDDRKELVDPCPQCIPGGVCRTPMCGRIRSSELRAAFGSKRHAGDADGTIRVANETFSKQRTGWPPGLLQDDDRKLSKALASTPDARRISEEQAEKIALANAGPKIDVNMHVARLSCAAHGVLYEKKPGFWSWVWRTQA